jgi:hypothetical protein
LKRLKKIEKKKKKSIKHNYQEKKAHEAGRHSSDDLEEKMISFVVGLHCYGGRRQIVALFWFSAPDCRDILVFGARLKKKNIAD